MKTCSKCEESKELYRFGKDRREKDGLSRYCRGCIKVYREKFEAGNPTSRKNRQLKTHFGITLEEYTRMLEKQNFVCKICQKPETRCIGGVHNTLRSLCVDHCHKTGKIRGLLCAYCNKAIGLFNDDITLIAESIKYLSHYNT